MDVFTVHIHFNIFLARVMSAVLYFWCNKCLSAEHHFAKGTENDLKQSSCRHTEGLLQTSSCSVIGLLVALGRKPLDSLSQSNWLGLPSQGYFLGTLIISLPASL